MPCLGKFTANDQKRLNSVSFKADFLYDKDIDHTDKKAQNSDFERGRLQGENEVVKFENMIFAIFLHFYYRNLSKTQ